MAENTGVDTSRPLHAFNRRGINIVVLPFIGDRIGVIGNQISNLVMVRGQAPVHGTSEPFQPRFPLLRLFRLQVGIRVDTKSGRTKLLP